MQYLAYYIILMKSIIIVDLSTINVQCYNSILSMDTYKFQQVCSDKEAWHSTCTRQPGRNYKRMSQPGYNCCVTKSCLVDARLATTFELHPIQLPNTSV